MKLSALFTDFFHSEKAAGLVLVGCTAASLLLANSSVREGYIHAWHHELMGKSIEFWINDGLMTLFFLLVGLEIEREIYIGELADWRRSMLPIFAAIGGMVVPALIHFIFNHGNVAQRGIAIPMATDIAFSLGILSLLGKKVPPALKVFLTALAIIDDLGAILVIAIFYSSGLSVLYLSMSLGLFVVMVIMGRKKVYILWMYLVLGVLLWYLLYRSGIHATLAGILVAAAIPFGTGGDDSLSFRLQRSLHRPVAFIILPLFALANTAIAIPATWAQDLGSSNSLGIILGLLIGKPVGIFFFSLLSILLGLAALPEGLKKVHILWTGLLAGIGFTMSIFITQLAFGEAALIIGSKIAIMVGSLLAGLLGYGMLYLAFRRE